MLPESNVVSVICQCIIVLTGKSHSRHSYKVDIYILATTMFIVNSLYDGTVLPQRQNSLFPVNDHLLNSTDTEHLPGCCRFMVSHLNQAIV